MDDDDIDDNDDFFASLDRKRRGSISSNRPKSKTDKPMDDFNAYSTNEDDDFFASLDVELATDLGEVKEEESQRGAVTSISSNEPEDDFFSNLEAELHSDFEVKEGESKRGPEASFANTDSEDDFFSMLEAELSSDLEKGENEKENEHRTIRAQLSEKNRSNQERSTPENASTFDVTTLQKRTVPELKDILRGRGLKVSGKKAELINRITSEISGLT